MFVMILALVAVMFVAMPAMATEVAVVDVDKIFTESKHAKAAAAHLTKVQSTLQQGMDKLLAMHKNDTDKPEVQGIVLEAQQTLNTQLAIEAEKVDMIMSDLLTQAVKNWRKANSKYEVVMSSRLVLDFAGAVDVTAGVMKEFEKLTPKFPDMPTVQVTGPDGK